jgi:signal transduction histidine kinase
MLPGGFKRKIKIKMNQKLQNIMEIIQQSEKLDSQQKDKLLKAVKDADKELEITAFKLERTEKVKKTTAILLEETIEELEQKRKDVEKHNRELEIEASLERVRAVAMGMDKSGDLLKICEMSFKEFQKLGFDNLRNAIIHTLNDDKRFFMDYDFSELMGGSITKIDYDAHPIVEEYLKQIKSGKDAFAEVVIKDDQLDGWKDFRRKSGQRDDPRLNEVNTLYYYGYSIVAGDIGISTFKPIDESQIKILKRFRNVFDLAYRRYNDIALAEAQTRESQIQLALERIRARTMAMQKSNELKEVIQLVYEQFVQLNINIDHAGFVVDYTPKGDWHFWIADKQEIPSKITHPYFDSVWAHQFNEAKEKGIDFFATNLNFEEKNKFYQEMFKHIPSLPEVSEEFYFNCPGLAVSNVLLDNVALYIENFSGTTYTDEENNTLMRFGKVFQQTYTRFLDLQKAEAQAREVQIEAALERVRARTMAMHKSDELTETAGLIFKQLNKLGIHTHRCNIMIIDEELEQAQFWSFTNSSDVIVGSVIPMNEHPVIISTLEQWKRKTVRAVFRLAGQDKINFIRYISKFLNFAEYKPENIDLDKIKKEPAIYTNFYFRNGVIIIHTTEENSEADLKIMERFTKVFEQTYTRFLDLQKAEAQAREAQIEVALERVRAKAMAMHSSNDISDTMGVVFTELPKLGISSLRCGVVLLSKDSFKGVFYAAATTNESDSQTVIGEGDMSVYPIFMKQREYWTRNENYFVTLSDEELQSYYKEIFRRSSNPYNPKQHDKQTEHGYYFSFSEGMFYAWTEKPYTESDINILNRFKSIIDLTFRRYFDLKKAEAQAREAIKQASLDRIRGEIASMRTAEDLNRITPIIWRELTTLEVPFIRCGVFIVDETQEKVQVYLSTPDGKSLGVLNLSFDENEITNNTVEFWKKKQIYKEHWTKEEFINWTKSMIELGQVQNAETYQGSSTPPESLNLHFVPFTQGMLYVGNTSPLSEEKIELVKTLAEAFSIAYARYEDFKNLEEAKNKIELTLSELKSAQAQLVHSEKMASLGELTAGIAHEIKNPLNFVNNFSEISGELLDEIKEELEKNDKEEVLAILEDLKGNLEKINQHGKRADSIVKGMLLHSRGTSGEKTLTDINDLLDQYVNLAYHGMRAQNKDFNITIEKNFDKSLEKINLVPQDISRVFLNIINNACYAAYDRKKKNGDDFSPVLKVSTKNLDGKVEIRIGDNGNGIPKDILDKIFQPFFTTKPTGEGTGLGLSLSYDIVTKVHSGELKVETKEGEGAKFIVMLPKG